MINLINLYNHQQYSIYRQLVSFRHHFTNLKEKENALMAMVMEMETKTELCREEIETVSREQINSVDDIRNYLSNKYEYTQKWFLGSELFNNIYKYLNPSSRLYILEIGCYEGLSSVFLADFFINEEGSKLDCVDPFDSSDTTTHVTSDIERVFLNNINKSHNKEKISLYKNYSDDFFCGNYRLYDFIYVDGSHEPLQMRKDMINAYNCCKINGIIWLDDYRGGGDHTDGLNYEMKESVDVFLRDYKERIQVIHDGYQLGIRKIS